jgi:transcriptional regulator with XRE-family HTH domain
MKTELNEERLWVELARQRITQRELAARMCLPPTTLNGWLKRAHRPPADLTRRIERALGLSEGALSMKA